MDDITTCLTVTSSGPPTTTKQTQRGVASPAVDRIALLLSTLESACHEATYRTKHSSIDRERENGPSTSSRTLLP
jgi:hypothetical protein